MSLISYEIHGRYKKGSDGGNHIQHSGPFDLNVTEGNVRDEVNNFKHIGSCVDSTERA